MQAQTETREELIGELRAKATTIAVKDFTTAGVRLELNLQGEFSGRYDARHIETVTSLSKPDGTGEYEGRAIQTTSDGDILLLTIKGRSRPEGPTNIQIDGETSIQTQSKKLEWLNSTRVRHTGTVNTATGEMLIKAYGRMQQSKTADPRISNLSENILVSRRT